MQTTISADRLTRSERPTAPGTPQAALQTDFSSWVRATSDPSELVLHESGFTFPDLFSPQKLAELTARFDRFFAEADPKAHAEFGAYRACKGEGMKPEAISS